MEKVSDVLCNWGHQQQYKHRSDVLDCDMQFSVFVPPQVNDRKVPVLYWLSGLTCTDENFVTKAGAQRYAAQHGMAVVAPDTSPRGDGVPDDEDGAYDFGLGAGFYVNATREPWSRHYQMYDYIVRELPALIAENFAVDPSRAGISGHSMGGHGALTIALKNPGRFRSVSAFAPICTPMNCPWGEKALAGYLGPDRSSWAQYDACELLASATERLPILVDQGDADDFLEQQLRPAELQRAAHQAGYPLTVRMQQGYDHSYFFIASFIGDHLAHHAEHL